MYFTAAFLAAVLPLLAVASPAPVGSTANKPFTIQAIKSGSDIQFQPLTASEGNFYIGKGDKVGVRVIKDGQAKLAVTIEGNGQFVYVPPTGPEAGALSYTKPQESLGTEVLAKTFANDAKALDDGQGRFSFAPPGSKKTVDFLACPTKEDRVYQVFANIDGVKPPMGDVKACLDFDAVTSVFTGTIPKQIN